MNYTYVKILVKKSKMKTKFPIYKKNPNLIYLDNAATTQKPQEVVDAVVDFYTEFNSNVHRGSYAISERATGEFENCRKKIAKFINAKPSEIIFTSGTTDSLNLASELIYFNNLAEVDANIAVPVEGHHALILPFRRFFQNQSFYTETKEIKNSDIALIAHVSNVTGKLINPNEFDAKLKILDCAQSAGHMRLDVEKLNVDFLAFSAHKMYGPMGVGILWVKEEILSKCNPVRLGGGIVQLVDRENIEFSSSPNRFEPGTPNVAGVLGFGAAIDFLSSIDFDKELKREKRLKDILVEELQKIVGIRVFTDIDSPFGIVSFAHERIHAHDIAASLGEKGICVRAGHHCTHIYHREVLNTSASVRVSFGVCSDEREVLSLVKETSNCIDLYSA